MHQFVVHYILVHWNIYSVVYRPTSLISIPPSVKWSTTASEKWRCRWVHDLWPDVKTTRRIHVYAYGQQFPPGNCRLELKLTIDITFNPD